MKQTDSIERGRNFGWEKVKTNSFESLVGGRGKMVSFNEKSSQNVGLKTTNIKSALNEKPYVDLN